LRRQEPDGRNTLAREGGRRITQRRKGAKKAARCWEFYPVNLRRIRILGLTCCTCSFAVSASLGLAQRINLAPVTRTTLKNGIRVVLMEYHRAPTVTIVAAFPGGDCVDPQGKAGLATMTAELLRKGTQKRSAVQIAEE